ncbi:hypothetical protein D8674_008186 [Pyrus ussuriensis x Pyrus communis]|uniref:Uncharacterized protein n=1 Tax=Pyrus ussuriensis x Pyrus communis TaxID=2448454 RepID=A0A5N5HV08_9ROSA|nr:hypothetical protein D8674_008186 [Pyrus ussuriensis x Pyrus communis]
MVGNWNIDEQRGGKLLRKEKQNRSVYNHGEKTVEVRKKENKKIKEGTATDPGLSYGRRHRICSNLEASHKEAKGYVIVR